MNIYHLLDIIFAVYLIRGFYYLVKAIRSKEKDRIKYQLFIFVIILSVALLIKLFLYP